MNEKAEVGRGILIASTLKYFSLIHSTKLRARQYLNRCEKSHPVRTYFPASYTEEVVCHMYCVPPVSRQRDVMAGSRNGLKLR